MMSEQQQNHELKRKLEVAYSILDVVLAEPYKKRSKAKSNKKEGADLAVFHCRSLFFYLTTTHPFSLSITSVSDKFPSLLHENYQHVNGVSHTISKSLKMVDSDVLMHVRMRKDLLRLNGMDEKGPEYQAQVLIDGYRALNRLVNDARNRDIDKIRRAMKGKLS